MISQEAAAASAAASRRPATSPSIPRFDGPARARIICMGLIANLQYGWTLFVNPIESRIMGAVAIQLAFSIFVVVETWLVPVEGWLVDRFGPRP
jgi:OFA family oxalate/formate antiporter-like MFS transporter